MNVFVLTGAGVSAESGVPTFRDADGLWERHRIEDVATPEGFKRDRALVRRFYDERRRALLSVRPNAAHRALARLERGLQSRGDALFLCTQNVDDLHERAGARAVLHMHGELTKARCITCGVVTCWTGDVRATDPCPACGRLDTMRPHVVWFGEVPLALAWIEMALDCADLFAAIGTSGAVSPASNFVDVARCNGARTIEFNLDASSNPAFIEQRLGPASETVPLWIEEILSRA